MALGAIGASRVASSGAPAGTGAGAASATEQAASSSGVATRPAPCGTTTSLQVGPRETTSSRVPAGTFCQAAAPSCLMNTLTAFDSVHSLAAAAAEVATASRQPTSAAPERLVVHFQTRTLMRAPISCAAWSVPS
ncbi:MAG: hypothetical protein A2138_12210 [Deltaproteobacteria bacterium RBG_16_71_12]|nr:MAG: hypothetical protein A2138_12210 [Deltaproteobacteria bacterium RBG_16_71_12]